MSNANPRYAVPENVSDAAKAILGQAVDMSFLDQPTPSSADAWEAQINESNAPFATMIRDMVEKAPVEVSETKIAGVVVREVVPTSGLKEGRVLLNVHGGGFTMFGGELSVMEAIGPASAGYRVLSVDYRMLPHHPFPAAVEDSVAVYRAVLNDYAPERIAVFGTSAGGALTASLILAARDEGLPLPAATVMHTPWSDLARIGDSYETNEGVDPFMPSYELVRHAAAVYAGEHSMDHPLISPVYADFTKGFPPSLLSTGTRDLLLSCTIRLHRALRAAGVDADLHVYDAMWHGFSGLVPEEGQDLARETMAFLDRHLAD